jgi:hypothetical protein
MRKHFYVLTLLGFFLFSSCEKENEIATDSISTTIFNDDISNYLNLLKKQSNKKNSLKIEALVSAIDLNSVKIYDLKTTEKLVIVDLKSLKGFENSDKNKVIFFLNDNRIVRANIVTFNNVFFFDQYNKVISSTLNMDKNKALYSGKISFYNLFGTALLSDEFENGNLTNNGIVRRKTTKKSTGKTSGCTDWYWVTTYSDGRSSQVYLYTTCTCEEEISRTANPCGGGDSGSNSGAGTGSPSFPFSPKNNDIYEFTDKDGLYTKYKFNSQSNTWIIVEVILPPLVISRAPEGYPNLAIEWPQDQQKVLEVDRFIYTYDSASGNWSGVPATDELIAEAIEDQIDDTKLDPCTKDILNKLKNLEEGDITKMLKRFSPSGSIFNINMSTGQVTNPNDLAQTRKVYGSTTDINMVFNEDYITGKGKSNRPTDLSIATTMAHEVIHAYLISLLEENKTCGDLGICDFPTVYEAYVQQQIVNNPKIIPNAHHELIAQNYVKVIAATIQEFHTGIQVPLGSAAQVYNDLAWSGLFQTTYFNAIYPNDTNDKNYKERERIRDRYNTEKNGTQYQSYTPIGTPCK